MSRPSALTALLAGAALAFSVILPTSPSLAETQPAQMCPPASTAKTDAERTVIDQQHTDAVTLCLDSNKQMQMLSLADFLEGRRWIAPDSSVFHVKDALKMKIPEALGFTGAAGKEAWLIPQVQNPAGVWAGWNTELIRQGMVDGDSVRITLNQQKSQLPEGGQVEVFQYDDFTGLKRAFSSKDPKFATYDQFVPAHVHANWTFTQPGIYRLVFDSEATIGGKQTTAEAEYVFAVGDDSLKLLGIGVPSPDPSTTPVPVPPSPSETPTTSPGVDLKKNKLTITPDKKHYRTGDRVVFTAKFTGQKNAKPSIKWQTQMPGSQWKAFQGPAGKTMTIPKLTDKYANLKVRAIASLKTGGEVHSNVIKLVVNKGGAGGSSGGGAGKQSSGGSAGGPVGGAGGSSGGSAVDPCIPASGPQGSAGGGAGGSSGGGADPGVRAPAGQRIRVTEGHFDLGARLSNGRATAEVKDDRKAPPIWRNPDDVEFIVTGPAKKPIPAGYNFLGKTGDPIYMISQVQESGVPWLGWNTQDPEIMHKAKSVTMTLTSLNGPGRMHVFVGGGLGSSNVTHVFSKPGQSFSVPVGTHQHGYWAFSKPGTYTAKIRFTVSFRSGGTSSAEGTLHFTVGGGAQGGGSVKAGPIAGGTVAAQGAAGSQPSESAAPGGAAPQQAPAGDPCALPRTGASGISAAGAVGLGLVTIGGIAIWLQRRRPTVARK